MNGVVLVEMDLESEWFEWYKRKTTPWFIADPHPGIEWMVSQFNDHDCHATVRLIMEQRKANLLTRSQYIHELHMATFESFMRELQEKRGGGNGFL